MLDSWLSPTLSLLVLSWVVILRMLSEEDYMGGLDSKSEFAYVHLVSFSLGIILGQRTNILCSRNRAAVQPLTIQTLPPYM